MHEHFDAGKAFGHVEALAAMRRLAGTPGELEAQAYIRGAGAEVGLEMVDEEFSYSEGALKVALPATCLAIAAVSLAGSFAFKYAVAPMAIACGAVLLAMVYFGFKWTSLFERFASSGNRNSVNLVGSVKAREPQGTVLLGAHYDSKSQLMPVVLRAGLFLIGFLCAVLFALALIVLGILAATGADHMGSTTGFVVTLIPCALMSALVFNVTSNRSPGALDDASGVAVILEVARELTAHPLEGFDVRIVAFGCEEIGLCGSINYLLRHESELRASPFYMLNFDMPFTSSGNIIINTAFEFPPARTSRKLNDLIRRAGSDMGLTVRGAYLPVGAGADHMPWVKHGFEAACMVSASTSIHSSRDSIDRVSREGLRRAGELTLAVLRALDQEATSLSKKVAPSPEPSAPPEDEPPT